MATHLPESISHQVLQAQSVLEQHLKTIQAIHLFGSAVDGGLKPLSDIDLLVTVSAPLDDSTRNALMTSLLAVSAFPGTHPQRRALEVTVLDREDIVPWRYPTKRQMQFGEWLRDDINAGIVEPAMLDHDLAILLTKVRLHSIALYGPPAHEFFEEVPVSDVQRALLETLALWNTEADWEGDERNIVLALVRIWYTAMTGDIASKEAAANWAIPYLPISTKHIVVAARDGYLGLNAIDLSSYPQERMELLNHIRSSVRTKLRSETEN
ncbi:AadA family aminoglycoside 3''-O-nucleotidyltransferase [Paenalcaligenes suwonensis]|uniref:AadA family aminoglycoside 3''-O-nucleotidyltransferase n=1 Tax=Paenalcaligenes suwonensis TaxID=1202713 RepID=UPI0014082FD0|nr:AadA family aminoglycoside 3''-O-nucleotidyltransferase [Paenalcaligenes suwonensis]NHC61671.1 AadA family aminoglycoside 3''-O-nucleotidyltransferase [Paenalcaligenes suwonensis]